MSIKGKIFHGIFRYRHLLKGKLTADVIDENTCIETLRRETDQAAAKMFKKIEGLSYQQADFSEFYAQWILVNHAPKDKVILYFHGGGFVMGSAQSHKNIVGNFAKNLGINTLVFNYRLAPENPAPAAVYDSVTIYNWLLNKGYSSKDIFFVGDSAGGGILLATMLKIKEDGGMLPAGGVAFSPCTDMTLSGDSHRTRLKADPCTPKGANKTYTKYYVGEGDPMHPYASPLFGDLKGLPPIMIQVGNDETLLDDSVRFAEKAGKAGVEVNLKVWKGMFHCFPLLAPMFQEATKALDEACQFIRQKLL
ncbi:alpha/beta hydrolase [Anaerovorax odorimutans]|uniref:alpha/beta hydrolase n=1 Tax=Anaerovorax odorimutans TaxID=109327 RepID=UPI00040FCD6F|nr:alpha/beta hydrolase [Anaerovorax odorimutans]